jgi:hypothetical protein
MQHTQTEIQTCSYNTNKHRHTHNIVNFLSIFAYHNINYIIWYLISCIHINPTRKHLWCMTHLSEALTPSSGWTLLGDKTSQQFIILCHLWILSLTLTRTLRTLCGSLFASSIFEMDLQHWQKMTDPKSIGTKVKTEMRFHLVAQLLHSKGRNYNVKTIHRLRRNYWKTNSSGCCVQINKKLPLSAREQITD